MTTHRIEFVAPEQRLSLNDRSHWRVRHRRTKAWRETARDFATVARLSDLPRCEVRVTFGTTRPNQRRDPHNYVATVKPIVDGLVDAGCWADDTPDFVTVAEPRFVKGSTVVVELIELPNTTTPKDTQ